MKLIQGVLLIATLFVCNHLFGQRDKVYKGLESIRDVPADSVYRLDLSKSKLEGIPEVVLSLKNLQELDLSKNKISDLKGIEKFTDLRILNLTKNKFENFPSELCQVTSVRNLFLGKNNIKEIPPCIGQMQSLIVLDMWYNPIDDLPEELTQLRNLRSLDLSGLNFSQSFQKKWNKLLPWVTIEFEAACDCNK